MIRMKIVVIATSLLMALGTAQTQANSPAYQIDTLLEGMDSPWSLAFLPNGDMLITELGGKLRVVQNGRLSEQAVKGVPDVFFAGQGGLMDVITDQNFEQNQRIYLSFAYGDSDANATRVVSAKYNGDHLSDIKPIFTAKPFKSTPHHYSGRMVQLADGSLLLTVGDGFNYREQAQKLDNHLGKIVRILPDGNMAEDNPWASDKNALPEIWSMGHRNAQAIVATPDGRVFNNEHGPQGGDEINLIKPGLNYGWPIITHGIDYNFASISPYTEYPGLEQPLVDWTPSIAPAGMTFYTGVQFPRWHGDLFVVSLAQKSVRQIKLGANGVLSDQHVFPELNQRMRDIRTGPDGALYILTDGKDGKLIRISAR